MTRAITLDIVHVSDARAEAKGNGDEEGNAGGRPAEADVDSWPSGY